MSNLNPIAAAAAKMAHAQQEREQAETDRRRRDQTEYLDLLAHQGELEPDQVDRLAEVAQSLGRSPSQIVSDARVIAEAGRVQAILSRDIEALRAAVRGKRAKIEELLKEHKAEIDAQVEILKTAEKEVEAFSSAEYAMRALREKNPQLLADYGAAGTQD